VRLFRSDAPLEQQHLQRLECRLPAPLGSMFEVERTIVAVAVVAVPLAAAAVHRLEPSRWVKLELEVAGQRPQESYMDIEVELHSTVH
jgi:hypothetical protein